MAAFDNYAPAIINALRQRGLTGDCPMCKKKEWVLHGTPASLVVYETTGEVKPGGTSMPMAAMICRSCGFTGLFSLGALGFLNRPNAEGEKPAVEGEAAAAPETKTE